MDEAIMARRDGDLYVGSLFDVWNHSLHNG